MAKQNLTHRERLENTLSGTSTDQPPVALWRHFPVDDQSPDRLAAAAYSFQRTFDFDLVKLTPASSYCTKDWGTQDEWRGSTEGTRTYTYRPVREPDDWLRLTPLDPRQGQLGATVACLRLLISELGPEVPVLQTIFNPLSTAKYLVGGEKLLVHMRLYPDALRAGLKTIVESTQRFIEACKQTGIAGLFFAVQHASYDLLSIDEYTDFGRTYDLQVLEAAGDLWLNMLHLHGTDVMFGQVADYPVQIINWHDRDTFPSLNQGLSLFPGTLCGGLQREKSMVLGTPEQVNAEAKDAIRQTDGKRFILGTGCVLPIIAPYGNIMAARKSVEV
jgi:uroporphyrinogen decarboxylase